MEIIATKQPFKNGLRSRFIRIIVLVLTLSTIALSLIVGIRERNILEHSLASKGQSLLSLIAKLCQEPLVMKQTLGLDTIVHEATKDDDVLYAVVFDPQGNLLTSQFSSMNFRSPELAEVLAGLPKSSELQDIIAAVKGREPLVEFSAPVMIDIMTVGSVTIGMSRRGIRQQVTTTMLSVLALNLAAAMVLGVVLFLVSRNVLLRPIMALAQAADRFARGDLHAQISIPAAGELQVLVDSFNRMATDLQNTTVSKQYVDDIIGSMHDALFVTTSAGTITRVNSAACILLGYDEKELAGQHIDDLLTREAGVSEGIAPTVMRQNSLSTAEKDVLTRSGKHVPVLLSAAVMRDTAGEIAGIVCMAQDITEQKQAEAELRQAFVSLKQAQEDLLRSERLAAVGEASGRVAHEVLNPVACVLSRIEYGVGQWKDFQKMTANLNEIIAAWRQEYRAGTLAEYLQTSATDGASYGDEDFVLLTRLLDAISIFRLEREKDMQFLLKQVHRVIKIINALRESARTQRSISAVAIAHSIQEALELLEDSFMKRKIQVKTGIAPGLPLIRADETELIQVLTNLYRNAMQSIDEKASRAGVIGTSVSLDKGIIEIRITDNGNGIPEPHKETLFNFDFTTKEKEKGTGFGLGISRRLIRELSGDLVLEESTEGVGTTFLITIPTESVQDDAALVETA